ncbi:MAG: DUF1573 domain-containing protein [Phycisphaerae bacterium]|nr:DUF1573 domain-containing protein [Phycisphaerae bacterium]
MNANRSLLRVRQSRAIASVSVGVVMLALGATVFGQDTRPAAPAGQPRPPQPQQRAQQKLPLQITPSPARLGNVAPNSTTSATFIIKNMGQAPLTVKSAKPSCKCTGITDIVGKTINPGESIELKAALKAPPVPGPKDAKVFIEVNEMPGAAIAMLEGEVVMPLLATPAFVDALKGVTAGTVQVKAADGKPFRILSVAGGPPPFDGFDPAKDEPRAEYTLKWNLAGVAQPPIWWVIETDRPDCPMIPLRVRHDQTGSRHDMERMSRFWIVKDQIALGGLMTVGVPTEVTVELEHYNPRESGKIVAPAWRDVKSVQSGSPLLNAEILEVKPLGDDHLEVKLRLIAKEGAAGLLSAPMTITTATGAGPVPFFARVVPAEKK